MTARTWDGVVKEKWRVKSRSLGVVWIAALLLMAGTSRAEKPAPDYGRSGWYLGVGAGTGIAFLDDAVSNETGGKVDFNAGGSFNARGGYRLNSWFAVEGQYEGVYKSNIAISGVTKAASRTTNSFVANLKFLAPIWRTHPYFSLGPGAQAATFDARVPLDDLDTRRWDFMLRFGFGVDGYITENWLVNLELAPSIRFADYQNIPSETTDNVQLTIGLGVQYRF